MRELKVGDKVKPKIGVHAGDLHKVIFVFADGMVNITPQVPVRKNRYRLGAASANPSDLILVED